MLVVFFLCAALAELRESGVEREDMENLFRVNLQYAMLNDHARNAALRRALEKAVTPDSRLLDIGAGSGLLSMMAARARGM